MKLGNQSNLESKNKSNEFCYAMLVISTLKLSGWPTNLVFSQLKEYPISLNCYEDL